VYFAFLPSKIAPRLVIEH